MGKEKEGAMSKLVYPVIFRENKEDRVPFYVYVPDLDVSTQGKDFADAIEMARDLINLTIVGLQDKKMEVPAPSPRVVHFEEGDLLSFVDADPETYRKRLRNLSVKKNCTIPLWLSEKAEAQGINFSRTLQEALIELVG